MVRKIQGSLFPDLGLRAGPNLWKRVHCIIELFMIRAFFMFVGTMRSADVFHGFMLIVR